MWRHCQVSTVFTHIGEWLKLDDDKVSVVTEEDILKLSGGGIVTVLYNYGLGLIELLLLVSQGIGI